MGQGYTRQEAANILTGEIVQASHLNNELNQLVAAFNSSTGHTHDGTTAEGGPITKLGPNQNVTVSDTQIYVTNTGDTISIGGPSNSFTNMYVDNIYLNGSTTALALGDLSDVTLTSPVNNAILQYSTSSAIWFDTGSPTFPGNVAIGGDLQVDGNINVSGTANFSGTTTFAGDVNVQTITQTGGTATFNNITVNGTSQGLDKKYNVQNLTGTAYTLTLADNYKYFVTTSSSAVSVTVPANASVAFPVGSNLHFSQGGTGTLTFTGASGVTINGRAGDDGPAAQYVTVSIVKIATDTWDLVGALA